MSNHFTPTQYLIIEVLTARARLGEHLWTFPTAFKKQLENLESDGWVFTMSGMTEGTMRAGFTDKGKARWLSYNYDRRLTKKARKQQVKNAKYLRKRFGGKNFWKKDDEPSS